MFKGSQGQSPDIWASDPILNNIPSLIDDHIRYLATPFTNNEIKEACFSPHPLKSPGPDGISPIFFQRNWDTVSKDVLDCIKSFLTSGYILKEQNKTYITLIPKTERPQELKDFRPIYKSLQYLVQNTLNNFSGKTKRYTQRYCWIFSKCVCAGKTNDG